MNRKTCATIFLLIVCVFCGCKKPSDWNPSNVFVKLFPTDSIHQSGGCFEMSDGNYIIYGVFFNINGGSAPIIIKFDQSGKIIGQHTLPIIFHYVTIKPIDNNGKLLAVGTENKVSDYLNVCIIDLDGTPGEPLSFPIDSIGTTRDYLPDFVEEYNGDFTILGGRSENGFAFPFILRINSNLEFVKYEECMELPDSENFFPVSIAHSGDEYAITGDLADIDEGLFLRLDSLYKLKSSLIITDETGRVSVGGNTENKSDNSTVICGTYGTGTDVSGTLYVNSIDRNDNLGIKRSFFDYENLGKFEDINPTNDGGYILVATVNKLADHDLVSYCKIYLLKLRGDLSTEWSHTFNSFNPYSASSAIQTADGGYLVSGYEHTASYMYTMCTMKTDANGNIITK